MNHYVGRYAELYDKFYEDKPYAEEAAFVHDCLLQSGRPATRVLELACGTGRHALELEKRGYEVDALDLSKDMIAKARERCERAGSKVAFHCQDMREMDLEPKPWDAVICLFDSIGFARTNAGVQQVLRNVGRHLRPEGLLVFEFWHAAAMLQQYDPVRVRQWADRDGSLLRISETTLDCAHQLCHVKHTIFEQGSNGEISTLSETLTNRFFLVQEMALLLSTCGFSPVKWFAGYVADQRITSDTWHVVAVARLDA